MQINTGSGGWCKNDMLMLCTISNLDPDVIVISESNYSESTTNDNRRRAMFPEFKFYDKMFPNLNLARLTIMIKNKYDCERQTTLENDINPTIVLKLEISKVKHHFIIGNYRQWKGVSPQCSFNNRSEEDSIKRFESMTKIWTDVLIKGKPTYIVGDINIDRIESNDPERRQDIKKLIPILTNFQKDNNVILTNKKPTRFRPHQNPTLLDLVLTNVPNTVSENRYFNNFCSEHEAIVTTVKSTQITTNVQFVNTRDYKHLTPKNINNMINQSHKFNEIFNEKDPDSITNIFIDEMNHIINTLAPTRRVQLNKFNRNKIPNAIKETIVEVDMQRTKAINSMDREEFRQAKNLQSKLNKMMEKNHVEQIKKKLKGNRKWTTIKETKESNKIPTRIYDQDNDITSPKILANLFNNYFNDKIKKIREKFSNNNKMAIRILENWLKNPNQFSILSPQMSIPSMKLYKKLKIPNLPDVTVLPCLS